MEAGACALWGVEKLLLLALGLRFAGDLTCKTHCRDGVNAARNAAILTGCLVCSCVVSHPTSRPPMRKLAGHIRRRAAGLRTVVGFSVQFGRVTDVYEASLRTRGQNLRGHTYNTRTIYSCIMSLKHTYRTARRRGGHKCFYLYLYEYRVRVQRCTW